MVICAGAAAASGAAVGAGACGAVVAAAGAGGAVVVAEQGPVVGLRYSLTVLAPCGFVEIFTLRARRSLLTVVG